jgi:endonuclease/exonuclease/phosphatase family metal-dependent hydrolase
MEPIRVMSLNIWNNEGPWPQRVRLIREGIDKLDPDLIGFQEVLRGDGVDLLEDILDGAPYHIAFGKALATGEGGKREYGNAIASRWEIAATEVHALPTLGQVEERILLAAQIRSPVGQLWFSTTHLTWELENGHIRERQVQAIAEAMAGKMGEGKFPPIIVGDFNAVPESTEIRFLKGLHALNGRSVYFRDAWAEAGDDGHGLTWNKRNPYLPPWLAPDRRIDYILLGPPTHEGVGEILNCRVTYDVPHEGVWPSDHFGVYAEIRAQAHD